MLRLKRCRGIYALRKIVRIALRAECNSQATMDSCAVKLKLHLVDLLSTYLLGVIMSSFWQDLI